MSKRWQKLILVFYCWQNSHAGRNLSVSTREKKQRYG